MSDGIVPALEFGHVLADRASASGDAPVNGLSGSSGPSHVRRTLDLKRTEAPGLGEMPSGHRKRQQRRRYAVVMLDSDGRLTDQRLFSQLGWTPGTRVDIGVSDGHEIVVRRDDQGTWTLTARNMVLIPAPLRHWCGYDAGDAVLVVAVPSMSAVVLHNLETLDQALSARRYDNLWNRIGEYVPTVRSQGVTTHWLRHTTLTWVERAYGYGVASAYAGHAITTGRVHGVTSVYVKADVHDVATALAELTGEEHPLALVPPSWRADAVPERKPETEIASVNEPGKADPAA